MKTVYICNISSQQQDDVLPLPTMFPSTITLNRSRAHRKTPSVNTDDGENQPDDDVLPLPSMVFDSK